MAFATDPSTHRSIAADADRPVALAEKVAFALVVAYVVFLAASYASGAWLVDTRGQSIPTDFINVWAAGRLVLDGNAPGAYDWVTHKAVEEQGVGHPFNNYFGWLYPPTTFLFVAAALSLLPYLPAFIAWIAISLLAYAAVIRMIVAHRIGFLLACAFPGVLWNISAGQNGFLTAALLGGALGMMEKRPVIAGVFLGLLSYKPHFGLLFPLVLAVDGRWRVFLSAAITTLLLIAASWLAFGTQTWQAFLNYVPLMSKLVLTDGLAGFHKLQTVFGVVRWGGGDENVAWALQGTMAVTGTIAVLLIWRRDLAYEVKAAALAVAALLVTPYLYVYDLVVLAVPMAFLVRIGLRDGFMPYEIAALALASALVLAIPFVNAGIGLLAVLIVALLVCRRAICAAASPVAAAG